MYNSIRTAKRLSEIVIFPKNKKTHLYNTFKKFQTQRKTPKEVNGLRYDSTSELKVLNRLLKCDDVKEIKTQSIELTYKSNGRIKKYYPDIQLLMKDGSIIIIEVKAQLKMVETKTLEKYDVLKDYCTKNGFGYVMLDKDFLPFELIEKYEIEESISEEFVELLKKKKFLTYDEFKKFRNKNYFTTTKLMKLIYENRDVVEYNLRPFSVKCIFK